MKTILAVLICAVVLASPALAAGASTIEASFKAAGNCGQCKTRIEKALDVEGVKEAHWNKRTQRVDVEFLSPPLTVDSLEHLVANAGHDTDKFRASDSVYSSLPGCCRYRDSRHGH